MRAAAPTTRSHCGEEDMYKHIVVGTDGSGPAATAVDTAVALAALTGATLHIVHGHKLSSAYHLAAAVEVGVVPDIVESNQAIVAESERICGDAVTKAAAGGVQAEAHCVAGDAADALIRVATDAKADLIVVGNRGMAGARRFVLGSVPNKVSHHCPSSLLIVDTSHVGVGSDAR
jgi:nucleotide-binding universal stress UspA family protein